MLALEAAVTCCILAAAGPQRSRVLANLYKDERTRTLPVFPFLEKVYLERILQRAEVQPPSKILLERAIYTIKDLFVIVTRSKNRFVNPLALLAAFNMQLFYEWRGMHKRKSRML